LLNKGLSIKNKMHLNILKTRLLWNIGHGVNDIYWFMLPSLLPTILAQFGIRYGNAGGIITAFLGTIAVFSLILGKLSDSVSRPTMIGLGFLTASALLIVASLANTLQLFVVLLLAGGIGVSTFHPASYASIAETASVRPGRTYGMFEFWGSMAVFLMFLVHGLLHAQLEWRTILFITSLPGLPIGVLYMLSSQSLPPKRLGRAIRDIKSAGQEIDRGITVSKFMLLLAVVILRYLGIVAVINFTPTYLVREVGLSPSIASFATGVYFLGGLIFTPFAGLLCDALGPFLILLALTGTAFPIIFLIGLGQPIWLLPICFFVLGATHYGAGPAMNMITARMKTFLGKGEAFGYMMAAVAVTFSLSPLLFGLYADAFGLSSAFKFFSLPLMISFALLVLLVLLIRPKRV